MPNQNDTFSKLLQMISEEEFYRFAVDYAMSHPEMVSEMEKKYRKVLTGTKEMDIDQEVDACFVIENIPRGYYRKRWDPRPIDWYTTSVRIRRLLKRAAVWAEGDRPQRAVELGLKLLKAVLQYVGEEMEWNDDFYENDEQCITDILSLIRNAMSNSSFTVEEKMAVADEIDKLCRMEAFDYCFDDDGEISGLAEEIREEYLTDDERLEVLHRQYNDETGSWRKGRKLLEIWDFLICRGRIEEAEKLYHDHPESDALDDNYGKLLEVQQRDKEALAYYQKKLATNSGWASKWLWGIWRIHDRNGNYKGMLDALRILFADSRERMDAYHFLKKLVTEDWDKELDDLIYKVYKRNDYDDLLGKILVEEQRYNQLFDRLLMLSRDPMCEILQYKKFFTKEQISALAMRMEHFIKRPLDTYNPNRKDYQRIAGHIGQVASLGATGKKVAASTVDYLLTAYSNRPALRDELQKAHLC